MVTTPPIITLLTDFGEQDGYVGAMKGVMLGIQPDARLVDITHQIDPQNIRQAASVLSAVFPYYPPHTVHLVVVDPGVGSERDPIAVETPVGRFVAPDNGVLTFVLQGQPSWSAVRLDRPEYWLGEPSNTFHGRDIFSPVAAHLAKGTPLSDMGSPLEQITLLELPTLSITPHSIRGEVVRIDHFGNLLTNIRHLQWINDDTIEFRPENGDGPPKQITATKVQVMCGWHTLDRIQQTYSQVPQGRKLALVGSEGELEIAVNQGNAEEALSIKVGDPVTLHIRP